MYALEKIKHELASEIGHLLKVEVKATDFVAPPQANLGDLSLPCFVIGKKLAKNPNHVAEEISKLLKHKFIASCSVTGPYLNFHLNQIALGDILNNLKKNNLPAGRHGFNFGFNKTGQEKRVMIEYANQNTHKELHIGHLRNIAYGDAIKRILTANGYKVIPVSYINDFGINVAKTIWWLYHKENIEAKKIMALNIDSKGYFLGQQYAQSVERLESNPEQKGEVAEVMKQLESRAGEIYKLWKKTRQWNINQFKLVYKELGVKFKTIFYESDFIKAGLKMVEELKKKNILISSENAVIADLDKYNLGVLVVLRSDGTALYPVADLALAVEKIKDYKLDESLYIVDVRQGLYFDQLFKLLELLGYETKFDHLSYDFVKLPSGMMSSRTGNIIPYEDLKDMALEKAKAAVISRHGNWSTKKINQVSSVIAFGALKFEMIKVGSLKQITFDIDSALKFEGFTAAYLQYTYARIQSINNKADKKIKNNKPDFNKLTEQKEKTLILHLANFPEIIKVAGAKKDPAEIAKYLFDLAQASNDYYHAIPVLKSDPEISIARLALLNSVALVIKQGLALLGIDTIDEM